MVMFSDIRFIPNVKGGPKYCIACNDTSVNTSICCLVSTAVIISLPDPNLKSPAVLVAVASQVVGLYWLLNRINRGSCVPTAVAASQPKTIICRSRSETSTFLATVGVPVSAPVRADKATARVPNPSDLSQ